MNDAGPFRDLPAVDRVAAALPEEIPHALRVHAARAAVDEARAAAAAGREIDHEVIVAAASTRAVAAHRGSLIPVLNATGVLIHTNLGRVPLGDAQLDAVREVAAGYSTLEYDLASGGRGSRHAHAEELLRLATGCEAALVANNNAAAVLVVLAALCAGREVVVSRGELVEIGGEFRIPDVLAQSGARLVEVGTTNRTHLADYERAIGPDTAALMKVHPSNYRVVGFAGSVSERDLGRLARGRGVPLVHDLGSGLVGHGELDWTEDEPALVDSLEVADVVTASGDKLLGGPQAGLILGRSAAIERIARHPLMRAVRPDKMTLAALVTTLRLHLSGRRDEIPLWRAATQPLDDLERRARALAETVGAAGEGAKAEVIRTSAVTGGGSLPGRDLESWGVSLAPTEGGADELAAALRRADPPVIGRIQDDRVVLDLRSVAPEDDTRLRAAVMDALGR
ncbi:MAG TPA: L-seryl-tRNA(Sec) selenium transferase [Actinomycetota bacterium]|nr:L-seryl-tRNA(Sec) selenium transferase [Actinomycetota bacterium]